MRKVFCIFLAFFMLTCFVACSEGDRAVPVEQAGKITAACFAQDRYAGVVISENITKIEQDTKMSVDEIYVKEGETVSFGQKLFQYDGDALGLELDKQELELEKLKNEKDNHAAQLKDLKMQLSDATSDDVETQLKIQIGTLENSLKQLDYDIKAQNKTISQLKNTVRNVVVVSPVDGTIRKISIGEENSGSYITIQQAGAYRIKGKLNELSMGGGLIVGTPVRILSRIDDQAVWYGTVSSIDLEGTDVSDSAENQWMGGSTPDPMASSSSYAFYVDLDDTENLLLGQHVYVQVNSELDNPESVWLPETYFEDIEKDEEREETIARVYAVGDKEVLERREVILGRFDENIQAYEVLSGLEADDFVADPASSGCAAGAQVSRYHDSSLETKHEEWTQDTAEYETFEKSDKADYNYEDFYNDVFEDMDESGDETSGG